MAISCISSSVLVVMMIELMARRSIAAELISASFVFGDSLVDAGNNNYLQTLSHANYPHFGIDFPPSGDQPTGRYTNGLTIPDLIGLKLGLPGLAPPYLAPTTKDSAILQGVNYASGGGGILNETGKDFLGRLSFDVQISYFEQTMTDLRSMLGEERSSGLMAKALVSVTIGANDFLNNYLMPFGISILHHLSPQTFLDSLISRYRLQLTRIYKAGARKMIIVGVPPIGCTPYLRTMTLHLNGKCDAKSNALAASFNDLLTALVGNLSRDLPGVNLVYADAHRAALDIVENYQNYGFEDAASACCGKGGPYRGLLPCRGSFPVCPDRSKFFFWDPFHPTQAVYELLADEFLNGTIYTSPMNILQLALL